MAGSPRHSSFVDRSQCLFVCCILEVDDAALRARVGFMTQFVGGVDELAQFNFSPIQSFIEEGLQARVEYVHENLTAVTVHSERAIPGEP